MRRRRTRRERLAICERDDWHCCLCGLRIDPVRDKHILEHEVPLAGGGSDDDANLAPAHYACSIEKTKTDLSKIAKGKRIKERHLGVKKPATFRGWRTFSGTPKWNPRYGR